MAARRGWDIRPHRGRWCEPKRYGSTEAAPSDARSSAFARFALMWRASLRLDTWIFLCGANYLASFFLAPCLPAWWLRVGGFSWRPRFARPQVFNRRDQVARDARLTFFAGPRRVTSLCSVVVAMAAVRVRPDKVLAHSRLLDARLTERARAPFPCGRSFGVRRPDLYVPGQTPPIQPILAARAFFHDLPRRFFLRACRKGSGWKLFLRTGVFPARTLVARNGRCARRAVRADPHDAWVAQLGHFLHPADTCGVLRRGETCLLGASRFFRDQHPAMLAFLHVARRFAWPSFRLRGEILRISAAHLLVRTHS